MERRGGAERWSDVEIEPNAGLYAAGTPIGMVWEMYELTQRDGSAKYRVAISVQRADRGPLGALAARLFDGLGRTVGRTQTRRDNLTLSFDRTVASASALVEFLSLDLTTCRPASTYSGSKSPMCHRAEVVATNGLSDSLT